MCDCHPYVPSLPRCLLVCPVAVGCLARRDGWSVPSISAAAVSTAMPDLETNDLLKLRLPLKRIVRRMFPDVCKGRRSHGYVGVCERHRDRERHTQRVRQSCYAHAEGDPRIYTWTEEKSVGFILSGTGLCQFLTIQCEWKTRRHKQSTQKKVSATGITRSKKGHLCSQPAATHSISLHDAPQ